MNHISFFNLPEQTILINGLSKSHAMTGGSIEIDFRTSRCLTAQLRVTNIGTAALNNGAIAAIEALSAGKDDAQPMKVEYLGVAIILEK